MRALPCLFAAAAALAAPAGAGAETADVDGDGRADTVRIDAPGQIVIERAGGGGAFVPFGLTGPLGTTRLSIGGKGRPFVVAVAQIGSGWEAVALRWDKGAMKEVWRGPVGPIGDDGEYELWIEARPSGLVRWQRRADLDRCDGTPVELFREGWDDGGGGFRAARPSVRLPDIMPTVTASPSAATGAGWYRATGATTAAGAGDASQLVPPRALDDGDATTAWREDRGGDGTGEQFTFRTTMKSGRAAALRIIPGAAAGARGAAAGNRIKALAVIGATAAYRVELPAGPGATDPVMASFPAPIDGCVTVAILEVERRGTGNLTAIAELGIVADVELAPGGAEAVLAAQVSKGGVSGGSAARALASRGAAAVAALVAELDHADAAARPRLLAALARIPHPAVIAPVATALATGDLAAGDRPAAAELLAGLGPPGAAALLDLVAGSALAWPDVRVDEGGRLAAARVLARGQPLLLVNAAGQGSRGFRATLVELLAGAGAPALIGYLRGDGQAPDAAPLTAAARADVWRAAGKAAAAGLAADKAAAAHGMVAALEATADGDYELRYRLVAALGAIASGAEVHRLVAWLGRAGDGALARALHRVAAGALGINPTADARLALAALAAGRDAGTRLAAIRGLATEPTLDTPGAHPAITADETVARDAGDRALVTVVATDAWPELRRAAASALGLRCDRRGPRDGLDGALAADADLDVRVDALTALVTCRSAGIAARLLRLADDSKAELALRDRAVALYGQLHTPGTAGAAAVVPAAATDALLDRLDRWRGQAFSDPAALRLAIRAATALGALGDRRAAGPLLAVARDGAFPELQAAAVAALGALGRGCPRDAITLLRALAQSEQRGVALAARGALERCGR